jgi:hypothetical protein
MDLFKRRSLQDWCDIAYEVGHTILPGKTSNVELSWPLDARELETVAIRWPTAYQWPPAIGWAEPLFTAFKKFISVEVEQVPQPFRGVIMIQFLSGETTHDIAIDYSDYPHIDEECAKKCSLYFKMQYRREGYPFEHILPGGFVPGHYSLYRFLLSLREIRDKRTFSYDVYGRFSLNFAKDVRQKATTLLASQNIFGYEGGSSTKRYSRYLREIARSKICIDLPGNGDFCFRLIDYFAIGSCVIGPMHRTILHAPLIDREHIVYASDDLSDLVPLCAYYLENDQAREQICQNSRIYFDRFLHRDQLAAYYLFCLLKKLSPKKRLMALKPGGATLYSELG